MAETYHEKVHRMMTEFEAEFGKFIKESKYRDAYDRAYKAYELAKRVATDPGEPKYMQDLYTKFVKTWEGRLIQLKERLNQVGAAPAQQESSSAPTFTPDTTRSDITFDDIAGLDEVKSLLIDKVIMPLQHPEVLARYKKKPSRTIQLLLYGPPGTGKTMFAEALGNELEMSIHRCKASEIISSLLGESLKNMRAYMESIQQDESPRILAFIDEFDALAGKRSGQNQGADGEMNRLVNELLQSIDAMVKANKDKYVVFVATTNLPDSIDAAILRGKRLDTQIYVGLPDLKARKFLIHKGLGGDIPPKAPGLDLDALARRLKGYSSADISTICEKISDEPLFRHYHTGKDTYVTQEDIDRVVSKYPTSVPADVLRPYLQYNEKRGYKTPEID